MHRPPAKERPKQHSTAQVLDGAAAFDQPLWNGSNATDTAGRLRAEAATLILARAPLGRSSHYYDLAPVRSDLGDRSSYSYDRMSRTATPRGRPSTLRSFFLFPPHPTRILVAPTSRPAQVVASRV